MRPRRSGPAALAASLLLVLAAHAQPPADPLPPGARARLGTGRLRDPSPAPWNGAFLSADGRSLLAFSTSPPRGPGLVRIDVATGVPEGKPLKTPKGVGPGSRTALSADGTLAVSGSTGGTVVWATGTGASVARIDHRGPAERGAAALSADGKTVAVGGTAARRKGQPLTAVVWDLEKNEKRAEVAVLQTRSASVALSPDGKLLATWGQLDLAGPGVRIDPEMDFGRVVQFWDATTGKELGRARVEWHPVQAAAFSPDGRTVAVVNASGTVTLVDPHTGTVSRVLFGRQSIGFDVAFSPDGKLVAAAGGEGVVQLWRPADGTLVATVECPVGPLPAGYRELRFTGPGRAVVWGTIGPAAVIWEVPSGKLLSPAGGHAGAVTGVAFAADGTEVLTGGKDAAVLRWDPASGKELGEIPLRVPGFTGRGRDVGASVAFAPAGATAVVNRGGAQVYDLKTGGLLVAPPTGFDGRAVFAPDARTLVLVPPFRFGREAAKPVTLAVWDVATGLKLAAPQVPAGDPVAAVVVPDRTKLVTAVVTHPGPGGKTETLIAAWDLTDGGKKLGEFAEKIDRGAARAVHLAAAPDGATVLAATPDGRLRVVDLATGKVRREVDTGRLAVTAAPVFAPDGKTFAVGLGAGFGQSPGTVRVYDAATGAPVQSFKGHPDHVTCLAFSPDGKTLASGSADTTVLLWDLTAAGE